MWIECFVNVLQIQAFCLILMGFGNDIWKKRNQSFIGFTIGLQLRLTFHLIQQSVSVILLNMDYEAKELFWSKSFVNSEASIHIDLSYVNTE